MKLLTILFITSLLAASCTIQKRTFRNGYYISWNKSVLKEKAKHEELNLEEKSETNTETIALKDSVFAEIPDISEKEELVILTENRLEKPDSIEKESPEMVYTQSAKPEKSDEVIVPIQLKKQLNEQLETNEKSLNLFAINSLVFAIGYAILSVITVFSNLFVIAVICFVVALTFAIVAIIKWKRNKDSFWGTFFAVMALGLLALATLVLLLLILAGSI